MAKAQGAAPPVCSRAVCSMTAWSINCQPSRWTRRAAISPPPLPYSREIVMARMAAMVSGFTFIAFPPLVSSSHDKSGSYIWLLLAASALHTLALKRGQRSPESSRQLISVRQKRQHLPQGHVAVPLHHGTDIHVSGERWQMLAHRGQDRRPGLGVVNEFVDRAVERSWMAITLDMVRIRPAMRSRANLNWHHLAAGKGKAD